MQLQKNVSLKPYNTFGIDVKASIFCCIENETDLINVLKNNTDPLFIISGGSNMLLTKNINALVLQINTKGITTETNKQTTLVTAKAGENWHEFVQFCINKDLGGLENLSLIPGCVGSSPIQNIGAYGVELKDCFIKCKALNLESLEYKIFTKEECNFGYRDSIFKNEAKDKYIITEVTFELSNKNHKLNTNYGDINAELERNKITIPDIKNVSDAIVTIRKSKLPDPSIIGNSGSFFKNPIIPKKDYDIVVSKFPNAPHYPINKEYVKVPAGWLIDQAGFKGYSYKNAGVHHKQALVLINKTGNTTGAEVKELSLIIKEKIKTIYNIELETEVNIF